MLRPRNPVAFPEKPGHARRKELDGFGGAALRIASMVDDALATGAGRVRDVLEHRTFALPAPAQHRRDVIPSPGKERNEVGRDRRGRRFLEFLPSRERLDRLDQSLGAGVRRSGQ